MLRNYSNKLYLRIKNDEKITRFGFIIFAIIIGLVLLNIIFLNYLYFKKSTETLKTVNTEEILQSSPTPAETDYSGVSFSPTLTPVVIAPTSLSPTYIEKLPRDYFIPLGSGITSSKDWIDISGAQAKVNFSQYDPIQQILFEVSVNVPTGNQTVSIRLYNVTDKHPVWYSEVTAQSNNNSYLTSSPIIYDFGEKTYQVQAKTQLGYPTSITQSRIHVISKN